MTGEQLLRGRQSKGWNQEQAALRLGVSQPYLSLLERGARRVPDKLARKATRVYDLSASTLPLEKNWDGVGHDGENALASDLAAVGYPGLSYIKFRHRKNPAEVLLSVLAAGNLDQRLVEALPWVVWKFPEMNWQWLVRAAKLNDLQNRLGFVTSVARKLAEDAGEYDTAALLAHREADLERSRLAREDTLCHDSLTEAERRWLRERRSDGAKHWNLLTDISAEHLSYAA